MEELIKELTEQKVRLELEVMKQRNILGELEGNLLMTSGGLQSLLEVKRRDEQLKGKQ